VDDFILKPASDERILEVIEKVTRRLDEERKREEDVRRTKIG